MTARKPAESNEVMIARIDERVAHIHRVLPIVARHDRELLIAKILGCLALVIAATKYPLIIEAIGKVLQ